MMTGRAKGRAQKRHQTPIPTEQVAATPQGIHVLDFVEGTHEVIFPGSEKPRAAFVWKEAEQTLYISVPADFPAEYRRGFANAKFLHLIRSADAWFTPKPNQPYTLCVIDQAEFRQVGDKTSQGTPFDVFNVGEPLLLGFFPFDFQGGLAPMVTSEKKQAHAVIYLSGRTGCISVPLFVGGN